MAGNRVIVYDSTNDRDERAAIESLYSSSTDTSKCIAPDGSNGLTAADIELVWGTKFDTAVSWGEDSTTDSPWVNKLTLSSYSVTAGETYRASWTFKLRTSTSGKGCSGRCVMATSSYQILDFDEDTEYHKYSGSLILLAPITTSINITIDYGNDDNPATAYIKEARIEIWRVS